MVWRKWLYDIGGLLLLATALAIVGLRCWRLARPAENPRDPVRTAFCDFQDVIYYPARAAMAGVNPYDARTADNGGIYRSRFSAGNAFPLYSPLIFLPSLPFAILPLNIAEALYWFFNAALMVLYSYQLLRIGRQTTTVGTICALAAILLLSRPGHANAYFGAIALPLALATIGSWWLARGQPWLSAVLLAVACVKPTFGGPLFVLLLLRGRYKAALGGLTIAIFVNALVLAVFLPQIFSAGNLMELLENNQAATAADPAVDPLRSASRVDLLMVVERLTPWRFPGAVRMMLTFAVLGVAGVALRRLAKSKAGDDYDREFQSVALASLTITICIYHNIYDALLIAPAVVSAWGGLATSKSTMQRMTSWLSLACLLVPAVNYLSSQKFLSALGENIPTLASIAEQPAIWTVVCTLNAVCITVAWCISVAGCFQEGDSADNLQFSR